MALIIIGLSSRHLHIRRLCRIDRKYRREGRKEKEEGKIVKLLILKSKKCLSVLVLDAFVDLGVALVDSEVVFVGPAVGELAARVEGESLHGDGHAPAHELDALDDLGERHFELAEEVPEELVGSDGVVEDEVGGLGEGGGEARVDLRLLLPLLLLQPHPQHQVHRRQSQQRRRVLLALHLHARPLQQLVAVRQVAPVALAPEQQLGLPRRLLPRVVVPEQREDVCPVGGSAVDQPEVEAHEHLELHLQDERHLATLPLLPAAPLHLPRGRQLGGAEALGLAEGGGRAFLAAEGADGLFVLHDGLALCAVLGAHAQDQLHAGGVLVAELAGHDAIVDLHGQQERGHGHQSQLLRRLGPQQHEAVEEEHCQRVCLAPHTQREAELAQELDTLHALHQQPAVRLPQLPRWQPRRLVLVQLPDYVVHVHLLRLRRRTALRQLRARLRLVGEDRLACPRAQGGRGRLVLAIALLHLVRVLPRLEGVARLAVVVPQREVLQRGGNEVFGLLAELVRTLDSPQSARLPSSLRIFFPLGLHHLLPSFLLLLGPFALALVHRNGLDGVRVPGVVVMISALLPHHKFSIGVDGAVAFDEPNLVGDVGGVVGEVVGVGPEVLVLGDVVAGVVGLLVHVDAVEVDGLDLLLRHAQLPLALALHAVVVVVLVRGRLYLLAAPLLPRPRPHPHPAHSHSTRVQRQGGIGDGSTLLAGVELRGVVGAEAEEEFAIASVFGFFCGFGGGAEVRGVLATVTLLALACVFIFIIHFNSQPRRYFLSAYLNISNSSVFYSHSPHKDTPEERRQNAGGRTGRDTPDYFINALRQNIFRQINLFVRVLENTDRPSISIKPLSLFLLPLARASKLRSAQQARAPICSLAEQAPATTHHQIIQSIIMAEENLSKSKKSSRRNDKKEEKVELFVDRAWRPLTIDIAVTEEEHLSEAPRILRGVAVYLNEREEIIAYLLADFLKASEVCREDSTISFWDQQRGAYVFGFNMARDVKDIRRNIPRRFLHDGLVTLKVRGKRKLIVESLIEEQRIKYEEDDLNSKNKEKKIGEVVEKVALWRKFYTGFYDEFGNYIQKPLETAAQEVGIAKKTLDDYLLQIRNGKKYGFNFNDKVNAKIGELRAFVRDEKKKETK